MKFIGICIFFIAFFKSYACEIDTVYFHNSDSLAQWGIPKMGAELSNSDRYYFYNSIDKGDTIYCLTDSSLFTGVIYADMFVDSNLVRLRNVQIVKDGLVVNKRKEESVSESRLHSGQINTQRPHDIGQYQLISRETGWEGNITLYNENGSFTYEYIRLDTSSFYTYSERFYNERGALLEERLTLKKSNVLIEENVTFYDSGGIKSYLKTELFYDFHKLADSTRIKFARKYNLNLQQMSENYWSRRHEYMLSIDQDTLYISNMKNKKLDGELVFFFDREDAQPLRFLTIWKKGYLTKVVNQKVLFVEGTSTIISESRFIGLMSKAYFNDATFHPFIVPNELKYDLQAEIILYAPKSAKKLMKSQLRQEKSISKLIKKLRKARRKNEKSKA